MQTSSKRILFIGPKVFGYHTAILRALERAGYVVDYYDERPASTPLIKALIRVRPELVAPMCDAYFDRILEKAKNQEYDVVLVIKGEAFSETRILKFKAALKGARFVYYTWDSLKNFKNSVEKIRLFDKVYSFDRFDAQSHENVRHLPLFYIPAYREVGDQENSEKSIDLLFLGSIHSDRYEVMERVVAAVKEKAPSIKVFTHFFYQSKWVFLIKKLVDAHFRKIPWRDVGWHSLSANQVIELISKSKVLVDVHHPGQTGLTMRTIECIGAKRKIITTNPDIANYDFYRPENIAIIDRNQPVIKSEFFEGNYVELDAAIYEKYGIDAWVGELLKFN